MSKEPQDVQKACRQKLGVCLRTTGVLGQGETELQVG